VEGRSNFLLKWFPKGTGPESGVKTYALPAIWEKPDDFTRLGKAAQLEAAKLHGMANASKDSDALRGQVIALGKACKACHDSYRSPDYEKDSEN
jgi:cytochrome c556